MFAKQNPGKPRVRFPDELVFNDNVKEQDIPAVEAMLRRSSLQMDINSINSAGLTPLHQAVLDGNIAVTKLLVAHGADVNKQDEDFWTPLHAACAEGHSEIVRFLLTKGADRHIMTDNGERPLDLVEPTDFSTIKVMLEDVAAVSSPTSDSEEEEEENLEDGARQEDEDDDEEDEEDENIKGKARILDDEDVMGDLEYISPDEDEEEEVRRRRQRRSGAESCSGSGSGSDRGPRYRSGGEDQEDSEYERQRQRRYQRDKDRRGTRDEDDYYRNDYGSEDDRYTNQERHGLRDNDSDVNNMRENQRDFARSDEDASDGSTGFRRRRDPHYMDSGSEEDKIDRRFDERREMPLRHSDGQSPRYTPEDERFALDSDGNNNSGKRMYDYSSDDERRRHRRSHYDSDEREPNSQEDRAARSSSGERLLSNENNSGSKNRD